VGPGLPRWPAAPGGVVLRGLVGDLAERLDVLDAGDGTVLDTRTLTNFTDGTYLVWDLKGHTIIRATGVGTPYWTKPAAALFSGLFSAPVRGRTGTRTDCRTGGSSCITEAPSPQRPRLGPIPTAGALIIGRRTWRGWTRATPARRSRFLTWPAVGTNIVIRWPSAAGRHYSIDTSTNLQAGFPSVVGYGIPATPEVNCATVTVNQAEQQFFRVRLEE